MGVIKKKVGKPGKCVNRAIANMVTKGTYKGGDQNYASKYVLAVRKHGTSEFGVSFFDVNTLEIFVGQFEDD